MDKVLSSSRSVKQFNEIRNDHNATPLVKLAQQSLQPIDQDSEGYLGNILDEVLVEV